VDVDSGVRTMLQMWWLSPLCLLVFHCSLFWHDSPGCILLLPSDCWPFSWTKASAFMC